MEIKWHDQGVKGEGNPLYPGFKPGTTVLKKDSIMKEGALALPCDIIWERDIAVKLRDGTTIYVDVYRPSEVAFKSPAIVSWGPFGKNEGLNRKILADAPWRNGIPQHTVSSLENFEALDPAYWCNHGYAMVHPDIRGAWMSEGNARIDSSQEGRDGYDLVEWIAQQPWSNERVSFAGNSWLSQAQWFIGAERPPHLTCLAPWEGWNDMYNDTTNRGGIPDPNFQQGLLNRSYAGNNLTEDVATMVYGNPMWNDYYKDRKAKVEKIECPMYISASWTNFLHTRGTFRGYIESRSCTNKWLRVHNSHEWPDLYYPQNTEDLRKFFDHYMKDVKNDWIYTPPVRLCVLNPGHEDTINRPENSFPLVRQKSIKMHLDGSDSRLSWNATSPSHIHTLTIAGQKDVAKFTYTFERRTELTGFFALKLFVSSPTNAKDIDIFANISKLSPTGERLESVCIDVGYLQKDPEAEHKKLLDMHAAGDRHVDVCFAEGPHGRLRVSHRELDEKITTPHWPRYTHSNYQTLESGDIVPIEVELWPCGMIWEAGEKLQLSIAGFNLRPEGMFRLPPVETLNEEGSKIAIHTGGEHESYLLVPYIPDY